MQFFNEISLFSSPHLDRGGPVLVDDGVGFVREPFYIKIDMEKTEINVHKLMINQIFGYHHFSQSHMPSYAIYSYLIFSMRMPRGFAAAVITYFWCAILMNVWRKLQRIQDYGDPSQISASAAAELVQFPFHPCMFFYHRRSGFCCLEPPKFG